MKEYPLRDAVLLETDVRAAFPGSPFDGEAAAAALRFHRSLPMYRKTPLVSLRSAARACGVREILLKDESSRFGLKAFKGLGGSYAVFRVLCGKLGLDPGKAVFGDLLTEERRKACGEIVFCTATDGNHGRGVAWAARLFGCRAYVWLPAGSSEARRKAIEDAGAARAEITDLNYDRTVAFAGRMAEENGWILIQDTAWAGYETIPRRIIEGYLTMGAEAAEQLEGRVPIHVFLQAGVGAMAGGLLGYLADRFAEREPVFTIVEPSAAACLYRSAGAGDGAPRSIPGDPVTIMAGLNCGTPCSITWPVIRDRARFYCACGDVISERAMRALAHLPEGEAAVSGECGAVTFGAFWEIARDEAARRALGIDRDSVILLFSTEGDTDPEGYARIVSG